MNASDLLWKTQRLVFVKAELYSGTLVMTCPGQEEKGITFYS